MANRNVTKACAILATATCKTMDEFWTAFGRPDLAGVTDKRLHGAPVLLEIKHLAERRVPPYRDPGNVERVKDRSLRAAAKIKASVPKTPKAVREIPTKPTHKELMIERRAAQNLRIGYSNRNRDVVRGVGRFCEFMRAMNVKNGVGSRILREARQSAAQAA